MITLTRNKLFAATYCLMITAWACTLAVTAGADESLPSKTVRYSDLDISKPEGAKVLYQRIRAAARHVCDLSIGGDAVLRVAEKACVDTAIDNAVRKVDAPALTSLRFGGDIHLAKQLMDPGAAVMSRGLSAAPVFGDGYAPQRSTPRIVACGSQAVYLRQETCRMQTENPGGAVQIGEWLVDPKLDIISRGTETHKLEPRTMRLLLCLANSAGEVVSVDRLLTEVWSGVVVGSASVYQAVSQLRKLLGDVDPNPTYIATVPRKGYRLVAEVVKAGTASAQAPVAEAPAEPVGLPAPAARRRAWPLFVGAAVLIAIVSGWFIWTRMHSLHGLVRSAEDKSIAVLPFVDMSESKDQEYFSDGLSEELINHLSRNPALKVIARTSSFQFKGRNEDVRSIAGRLGVAHLLEGSVRKVGQELRVTTQLIRASDGMHLWSQTYDRSLADIFKVQDEISERVASALNVTLALTGQAIGKESDVEAYNLVLEGNYYKARRTKGDVDRAIQLYQRAIDIRPNYALPWARLASGYLTLEEAKGTPTAEGSAKIVAALDRAIQLDPNLVWAYYTRAGFEIAIKWDWAAAQADHERMRVLDPGIYLLPLALGDMALVSGHIEESIRQYERAVELNPLDPITLRALGVALCASERLQECLRYRLKLHQLHPELRGVNAFVGEARLLVGQLPEALDALQKETEQDARLAGLAAVYSAMGKRAESDAALKTLEGGYASDDAYQIAQLHAYRGEADASFEWLQRSFVMHNSNILFIKTDPWLRNLHGDPRFKALLANLRLPE